MNPQANPSTRLVRTTVATLCAALLASTVVPPAPAQAGVVRIGGSDYNYQGLEWTQLSSGGTSGPGGSGNAIFGGQNISHGNRTALALGLTAAEAPASTAPLFPGNAPFVLARYNPYTQELRIDIFKVERAGGGSRLMHTVFAPRHGDAWVAARAYISPSAYSTGAVRGVNPFASFGTADHFTGISMAGAKVALGHAMRLSGAASGLFAIPSQRMSSTVRKSGNLFRKRIETWVYGHVKTRWWLAFPGDGLESNAWSNQSAICATNPSATSCPSYATAVSGAILEEVEGGNLLSDEETWQLDYQRRSGLTVLGGFLLGGLGFMGGIGGIPDVGPFGSALGAYRADRDRPKVPSTFTTSGTMVVEPTYRPGNNTGVGGGSPGTLLTVNPGALSGTKGVAAAGAGGVSLTNYQRRLLGHTPSVTNPLDGTAGATIRGVQEAVYGTPTQTGMMPEPGQHVESNHIQFVRDSNGRVLRDLGN